MKPNVMSIQRHLALAALAASFALAAACPAADLREEFHQTYPFTKDGKVHLENVNGNVRILTWDREEVKVDAVKHARTQAHLEAVRIEVDAKADSLRIKTKYPDSSKQKNNSASVDYTLTVPKQSRLDKVSTVNGGVEIENLAGDVEASSVNGPVNATGLAGQVGLATVNGSVKAMVLAVSKGISLKSVNGSVNLRLPANANADVSATTVNGSISSDFQLQNTKQGPVGRKLEGKLGEGGPAIKMSSVNGGIEIENALGDVEASSVNGPVNASGMAGQVGLATVNGSVKATVAAVNKGISLKSVNGSVNLRLPANANADVSASTVNGSVSSDFQLQNTKRGPVGRKLEGKLGEGGPAIKLSSVNGGLRIDRANPTALEER